MCFKDGALHITVIINWSMYKCKMSVVFEKQCFWNFYAGVKNPCLKSDVCILRFFRRYFEGVVEKLSDFV